MTNIDQPGSLPPTSKWKKILLARSCTSLKQRLL